MLLHKPLHKPYCTNPTLDLCDCSVWVSPHVTAHSQTHEDVRAEDACECTVKISKPWRHVCRQKEEEGGPKTGTSRERDVRAGRRGASRKEMRGKVVQAGRRGTSRKVRCEEEVQAGWRAACRTESYEGEEVHAGHRGARRAGAQSFTPQCF